MRLIDDSPRCIGVIKMNNNNDEIIERNRPFAMTDARLDSMLNDARADERAYIKKERELRGESEYVEKGENENNRT